MTAAARASGWRGFDGIGTQVDRIMGVPGSKSGWEYRCDGMPSPVGCGESVVVSRRFTQVGEKTTGWLVTYGRCFPDETADDRDGNDLDVVLTFCPSCAAIVKEQAARLLPDNG